MKIIGTTKDGFIFEASETETYNLIGWYSEYSEGRPSLKPGDEVRVHEMYHYLRDLVRADEDMMKMAEDLKKVASLLEKMPEPVKKVELPEM